MIAIRAFPDKEGCKIRINLESRKLMWVLDEDPSAAMTRDRVNRLCTDKSEIRGILACSSTGISATILTQFSFLPLIDFGSFFETISSGTSMLDTLRTCQIYKIERRNTDRSFAIIVVVIRYAGS